MGAAYLRLVDVTKRTGGRIVIERLSLEVAEGEILALLGPSGCGKSTTLRLIAGLETPDTGEIWIGGERVAVGGHSLAPPHLRGIGFVFQDLALWPHFTVAANLDFALSCAKLSKSERTSRVRETLRMVRIDAFARRYPDTLSGGEQQRVALARALVGRPRLLLLDEPMSSLDTELKSELLTELATLQRSLGVTSIHVTHDQTEAAAVAHRVALMRAGRIEGLEPVDSLLRPPNEGLRRAGRADRARQ